MGKVRIKRRAGKNTKGILLSNPIVAAQVGAAVGSLLAAIYVEKPDIGEQVAPLVEEYGRVHEREDVIAYVQLCTQSSTGIVRAKLIELLRALRTGIHKGEGKAEYARAIDAFIGPMKEYMAADFQKGFEEGRKAKKGKR